MRTSLGLVFALLWTAALHAADVGELAGRIEKALGRPAGLVALPRGDADLALALAERYPRAIVHVQSPVPEAVRRRACCAKWTR